MKRQWFGAFAAVIATTALLGAQQNQQPANTPPADANAPAGVQRTTPAPSAQTKATNTVTFTGCIQDTPMAAAAAGAGGATASRPAEGAAGAGAAGAAGATKSFYLNNAAMASDAGSPRTSVGTTGSTAATAGYRLEGDAATLTPHLNHQVRIIGTVQSSNASTTGAANAAPGSTAAAQTLKVEKVEMVSATCETAKK